MQSNDNSNLYKSSAFIKEIGIANHRSDRFKRRQEVNFEDECAKK